MANYTKGKIAIPNVTGDVIINITAVAQARENSFPSKFFDTDGITLYNGLGYKTGWRFRSTREEAAGTSGDSITGYLDISGFLKVIVSGATRGEAATGLVALCYDSNHDVITSFPPSSSTTDTSSGTYTFDNIDPKYKLPANTRYIRFWVNTANCTGTPPALTVVLE